MREKEPAGQTMSTSTGNSKDSERTDERRSSPRETLKRYVVLVFFGEDNWGKLTNMSESGMAFEFAKPPSLDERVNFTFQAMGCMPMPQHGKACGDCFEAPGKIVWTREFERGAGVQFVDLVEASREQIRQWLSFETSRDTAKPTEQTKPEVQPTLAELLAPLAPGANTQSAATDKKESLRELDMPVPVAEPVREPDSVSLETSVAESYKAPAWGGQEDAAREPLVPQLPGYSHPSVARLTFLVVSGCLAAFAVTAGVRIFMTRAAQRANAEVRASEPAPGMGESTAEVNVSSSGPLPVVSPAASVTSSSAVSAPPFQVDVLDGNGRSWILWFVHGGAQDQERPLSYRRAGSSNSSAPAMKTTKGEEASSPEKREVAHTFTMVAPTVSHPLNNSATGKPSAEAPAIQPELAPSLGGPVGGVLVSQGAPAAPAAHGPVGGMVQQPRLLRSAPAAYPQLAKSNRVSGDVVVDALIDTTGNVTAAKVISGPVLLQQAAVETVRHWKYEPARLDGQAVAMHLTVTVRFRLN
jgi:TonB family protein